MKDCPGEVDTFGNTKARNLELIGYAILIFIMVVIVAYAMLVVFTYVVPSDEVNIIVALVTVLSGLMTYYFNEASKRNYNLCEKSFEKKYETFRDLASKLREIRQSIILYGELEKWDVSTSKPRFDEHKDKVVKSAMAIKEVYPGSEYLTKDKFEEIMVVKYEEDLEQLRSELSNMIAGKYLRHNYEAFPLKNSARLLAQNPEIIRKMETLFDAFYNNMKEFNQVVPKFWSQDNMTGDLEIKTILQADITGDFQTKTILQANVPKDFEKTTNDLINDLLKLAKKELEDTRTGLVPDYGAKNTQST